VTAVELRQVCKSYALGTTRVPVLDRVDLHIGRHERVALIGDSGSGKSTLLNLIGFLDRPDSGEILIEGRSVAREDDREISAFRNRTIGFVFQSFHLIPHASAIDNVMLPLRYRGSGRTEAYEAAFAALTEVGLAHRSGHRPNEMSGGERQRVAIARALVGEPQILLADEPTGNLDSRNTGEILDLFERIHARGRTLVVVTHSQAVAERCQRIIRVRDGRVSTTDRWS
jgi:putative ABC transport system ATP-binding protein